MKTFSILFMCARVFPPINVGFVVKLNVFARSGMKASFGVDLMYLFFICDVHKFAVNTPQ